MSAVLPVERIVPQPIEAIQVAIGQNGSTAGLVDALLHELAKTEPDGPAYITEEHRGPEYPGGWRIRLVRENQGEQIAYIDDWIVVTDGTFSEENGWQITSISRAYVYGISAGLPGTAVDFCNLYTIDCPLVWDAMTVAPTLVPVSGLVATLSFFQPESPNGPWTYSVDLTNVTTGTITPLTPPWTVDKTGLVTMTITDLNKADDYHATVTVKTQYATTATSVDSNTITAAVDVPPPPVVEPPPGRYLPGPEIQVATPPNVNTPHLKMQPSPEFAAPPPVPPVQPFPPVPPPEFGPS